ncbi:MAG: CRISPR system precrRNA processing endoribonuclease RAMP protein Cas6 [Bryobacteraceae bacterium]|nr:CRISPR system precrRNA processing endoribonuclease RAMP protein Cas6 [Bryobacteraceae bacterium]MDW8380442.1 CRISPR system precrRNA processing endoribonuclease RAMP protein Cas6 [Bryobacterales bacterium]
MIDRRFLSSEDARDLTFCFHRLRFHFTALDPIWFPEAQPANILRGALGLMLRKVACAPDCQDPASCRVQECPYRRLFAPRPPALPSGLTDAPRPFVFRAAHLSGREIGRGACFHFDIHVFERSLASLPHFVAAFRELATEGVGPRRGKVQLTRAEVLNDQGEPVGAVFDGIRWEQFAHPVEIDLAQAAPAAAVQVRYLTPTELKVGNGLAEKPDFGVLMARVRDRLSTLRSLYGSGPLPLNFRYFAQQAALIRMTHCEIQPVKLLRRSRRTGQTHPLGGFVGWARYEGNLTPFFPFLKAASFTGIGRQTVWGKGEIAVAQLD